MAAHLFGTSVHTEVALRADPSLVMHGTHTALGDPAVCVGRITRDGLGAARPRLDRRTR